MALVRSRFIIVNKETGIYSGMIYDRPFADKSAAQLRETWPGLSWEVEETDEPYPPSGRVCTGHVRAKRILKDYQQLLENENERSAA